jgi:hypothetical protein
VLVQGATRAGRKARSVQEDACTVDAPGEPLAGFTFCDDATFSRFVVELPRLRTKLLRGPQDRFFVVCIEEVRTMAAATVDQVRGVLIEYPPAPVPVDARPIRTEEAGIEHPCAFLVRVLEADPFVQILGSASFAHIQSRYRGTTTVAGDADRGTRS